MHVLGHPASERGRLEVMWSNGVLPAGQAAVWSGRLCRLPRSSSKIVREAETHARPTVPAGRNAECRPSGPCGVGRDAGVYDAAGERLESDRIGSASGERRLSDALMTVEAKHDPFLPLIAALATKRILAYHVCRSRSFRAARR